jgi:microcystin-dependent protein
MAQPFLSEIKIISWNFAPKGWAFCNGQTLPINQNQALFSLLGTTYGGNGQTTFKLPDLQGRVPVHFGQGFTLGQAGGETAHTLSVGEMPAHTHFVNANSGPANATDGQDPAPGRRLAASVGGNLYAPPADFVVMATSPNAAITNSGGSQPHNNEAPYMTLNFIIALQGIFPSQN